MKGDAVRYVSTRDASPPKDFLDVLLAGPGADGGLFLPERWPSFSTDEIAHFTSQPYAGAAHAVLSRFVGDAFTPAELKADIDAAYADFDTPEIVPLVEIGRDRYLLEL